MGRRSITDEAETEQSTANNESEERVKHTQRMPESLSEDVEEWADQHGMSKTAAINFAVRQLVD